MTPRERIAEAVRDLCRTAASADEIAKTVFGGVDDGIVLPTASRYGFLVELSGLAASRYGFLVELSGLAEDDAARMLREYREDDHPDL